MTSGVELNSILLVASLMLVFLQLFLLLRRDKSLEKQMNEQSKSSDMMFREEFSRSREEQSRALYQTRDELQTTMSRFGESLFVRMEAIESKVESKLNTIQKDNSDRLEQMRAVVEEKLQSTLERRLGESFKLVSTRLEDVQRGLGEMAVLAQGVGDLKRVLTNVKARGGWGERQLQSLLSEILTVEQYRVNVATKPNSKEIVEFAIRLPGRADEEVLLPVDAKFPKEDYERLLDAYERADGQLIEQFGAALESRIKLEAKSIQQKYVEPPYTTDFAILFLPVEGLYAEVLRRPGLVDNIQRNFRVVIAGPTTFAALLNSLQMGFKTLAIEKRSSEVWKVLGAVKSEFSRFGDVVDKISKKLKEASDQVDQVHVRTRKLQKTLISVETSEESKGDSLLEAIEGE
ncbi:MAG: DNA recombination protein RmuC [Pseudomonadota bacterium]